MYLKKELYGLIQTDESIFDFIQESALDGLWYWDLENPENEWINARFWTVLGYHPDDMPHKSSAWQSIINQDDLKVANENFVKHCEDPNYPYDQLARYTHKDGSTKWMRCRGLVIRDSAGKPIRMLGAHQDITELKRNEQELLKASEKVLKSEEKYHAFFNNAPLSYQSLDENGCFIDINPMWSKTLGYERDEVIGKWYGDFLHPDYVEHFRSNFPSFKKRGYVSDVQFKLRRKDNTYIYVSFEGCVGYTPEGKFRQTYCVFKDITEQKALEKALINAKEKAEESEARFRNLMENMDTVAVQSYGPNGITQFWNKASEKLYGYTQQEAIGSNILDLIIPREMKDEVTKAIHKMAETGEPIPSGELVLKHKDGSPVPVISHHAIVKVPGHMQELFCLDVDISERKRTEERLKESEVKFKAVIDSLPLAVHMTTYLEQHTEYINPSMVKMFGYTREEIRSVAEWWPLAYPDKDYQEWVSSEWNARVAKALNTFSVTEPMEVICTCKDGTQKNIHWAYITAGGINYSLGLDITERKQAEEALLTKMDELERFSKLTVGRELTMVELKKEVNNLLNKLGEESKYKIVE